MCVYKVYCNTLNMEWNGTQNGTEWNKNFVHSVVIVNYVYMS